MDTKEQLEAKEFYLKQNNDFLITMKNIETSLQGCKVDNKLISKSVFNALDMLLMLLKELDKLNNKESNEFNELLENLTLLQKKNDKSWLLSRKISAMVLEPSLWCVKELYKKHLGQFNNSTEMCQKSSDWSNTKDANNNKYTDLIKPIVSIFSLGAIYLDTKLDAKKMMDLADLAVNSTKSVKRI